MLKAPGIPRHIVRVEIRSFHTMASEISESEPPYLDEKLLKAVFSTTNKGGQNDKNPNSSQVDV